MTDASVAGATRCPRCGAAFRCSAGDTEPCPCTRVALDAATLASLRERYTGCLCLRCLRSLQCAPPPEAADASLGRVDQTTPTSATKSAADR